MMVIAVSAIHTHGVRVDTGSETSTKDSESADKPKAEALTVVIHKFVNTPSKQKRPIQVIDRNDDVVVIHSNRPKRRPNSRKRRPSSSQYRSKIKQFSPGSSSIGGFKDFGPSDAFRFPPFPTKNYGEPPRTSNKYKFRQPPSKNFESYNFNSQPNKRSKKPTPVYGPPPTFNQFESTYNQQLGSPSNHEGKLQTLQQQQNNFPSFSIDTVEPVNSNYQGSSSNRYPQPIADFPLDSGSSFNSPKTSYGDLRTQGVASSGNFQFNPTPLDNDYDSNLNDSPISKLNSNLRQNVNQNRNPKPTQNFQNPSQNFQNPSQNLQNSNFPKLPNRYEPKDFSTPTRTNPLSVNPFNDYSNYNDVSESQNVQKTQNNNRNRNNFNTFNKFHNFDYDFKGQRNEDDDQDDDNLSYLYTTRRTTTTTTTTEQPTTTKRPRKNVFGKRKRPAKIPNNHNLDTDDLRDAFTESSDFHEVSLASDDYLNFDSQRKNKRNNRPQHLHEIHSTLKTAQSQNHALRTALGDDFEILSIHKSLEKNPNEVDFGNLPGFERRRDNRVNEFNVGSGINFGAAASPVVWGGDFNNFPRNHRPFS